MILVTEEFIFEIERSSERWNIDQLKFDKMISDAQSWANAEIDIVLQKELITENEASNEKSHYIWKIIFNLLNVHYKRYKFSYFTKKSKF
jgi:hypothetical protein